MAARTVCLPVLHARHRTLQIFCSQALLLFQRSPQRHAPFAYWLLCELSSVGIWPCVRPKLCCCLQPNLQQPCHIHQVLGFLTHLLALPPVARFRAPAP
jgi:hypothetical protein